jgi:hypothetical protein
MILSKDWLKESARDMILSNNRHVRRLHRESRRPVLSSSVSRTRLGITKRITGSCGRGLIFMVLIYSLLSMGSPSNWTSDQVPPLSPSFISRYRYVFEPRRYFGLRTRHAECPCKGAMRLLSNSYEHWAEYSCTPVLHHRAATR